MSISYETFHPEVLPHFPSIPEVVVTNAIRNACIEFCDRTEWLYYTPTPISLIASEDEYALDDVPTDTTVARIESAWASNLPLLPKAEVDLRRIFGLDWRKQIGRPQYITQYVPETVIVVPAPMVAVPTGLELTLVLRPTRASTTVDDSLFERWAEVISYGAKYRLHETPGHAYENPDAAMKYRQLFNAGIGKAIEERQRGLTRATMRVRPPRTV